MAEHLFEEYVGLASQIAPDVPEDAGARATFIQGLEIPNLEGYSPEAVANAVFQEAAVVLDALKGASVPTDQKVLLHDSNSLRIVNDPMPGWYVTEVASRPYRRVEDPDTEHRNPPNPLMLSEEGKLYVYRREPTPTERPADGVLHHWYIPGTSSPENDRSILLGYARLVTSPRV